MAAPASAATIMRIIDSRMSISGSLPDFESIKNIDTV
jgi:hypothetical protein